MAFRFLKLFNSKGEYLPDSRPISLPVGIGRPPTLAEQVARLVRSEDFRKAAEAQGFETFEEADDFDVDDDPRDPLTPYEEHFEIAAVRAVDHGVVNPPTTQEHYEARDKNKAYFKRKDKKAATPPAEEAKNASEAKKEASASDTKTSTLT